MAILGYLIAFLLGFFIGPIVDDLVRERAARAARADRSRLVPRHAEAWRLGTPLDPSRHPHDPRSGLRLLRQEPDWLGSRSCAVDLHEIERRQWIDQLQHDLGLLKTKH